MKSLLRSCLISCLLSMMTSLSSFAAEYTTGSGSEFRMTSKNGDKADLSIYITESSFTRLGVEYFFTSAGNALLKTQVWQQFHLGLTGSALTLDEGYILSDDMKKAEIMTPDFLKKRNDGVNLEDFFFRKAADLEKLKVGQEQIEVPAGPLSATHFRKSSNGQTVDFWVSDKAGAIGLVKLVSTGKKESQNYKIELLGLLKNVKPKILPKDAVPLSDKGKLFLKDSSQ